MFFDALCHVADQLLNGASAKIHSLPDNSSSSMSSPLWISSIPVSAMSPCGEGHTHPSGVSPLPTLSIPVFTPGSQNSTARETWAEVEERRKGIAGLKSHALFATMEDSPPSSPTMSDTPSEEEDSESPVLLHHPRPKHASSTIATPASSFIDGCYTSPLTSPERSPSPPVRAPSRSPSLVPTIVASRSPSPRPHPCIAHAQSLGIKVRDFALETHGVPLAPAVPDLDQLRARYLLYRTAEMTPPPDVVGKLKDLDREWIDENARHFDRKPDATPSRARGARAWRRETKRWLGIADDAPVSAAEASCEVGEMTAKLKAMELDRGAGERMGE